MCCGYQVARTSQLSPFHAPANCGAVSTPHQIEQCYHLSRLLPFPSLTSHYCIGVVVYQLFCQLATKFQLADGLRLSEVAHRNPRIDFDKCQNEREHPDVPVFCAEGLIQRGWRMPQVVMVVNLVPVLEMVQKRFSVLECHIYLLPVHFCDGLSRHTFVTTHL